jgi:hypothetical protein
VSTPALFEWDSAIRLGGSDLIKPDDALRQERTAQEIIHRLNTQPGLILADEVGLGKTFVALAVAASVVVSTRKRRPVVVMVPPALKQKWPQEWKTFAQYCLPRDSKIRATETTITRPAAFLKLFDDDAEHRNHIIFLAHGALTRNLQDPYTRLALVQAAFRRTRNLDLARRNFPRWAPDLIHRHLNPEFTEALLSRPISEWHEIYDQFRPGNPIDDDPVYLGLPQMIKASGVDLRPLRQALAGIPRRESTAIHQRLKESQQNINAALQEVWTSILSFAPISSPLLILDEAHHVRHDGRISGLFQSSEAQEDGVALQGAGPLAGKFDHMLFLTATPFQLGHRELINVLSRFDGVRWRSSAERKTYADTITKLGGALDAFQVSAHRAQKLWSRLEERDLSDLPENWWNDSTLPQPASDNGALVALFGAMKQLISRVDDAEQQLRPWLIRHVRADRSERRMTFAGDAIRSGGDASTGLAIDSSMMLPFMLAARARTLALDKRLTSSQARAFFAEGIASSFEAYRDTRRNRKEFLDGLVATETTESEDLAWYLDWVERSLPLHSPDTLSAHPKVRATVERALHAWLQDEKVLIFCFYRETGRTLRREISAAIERELLRQASEHLGLDPVDKEVIIRRIERTADNVLSTDSAARRDIENQMSGLALKAGLKEEEIQSFVAAVIRFLRTESFIVRYVLPNGTGTAALFAALDTPDQYGRTLRSRLAHFLQRLTALSDAQRERALSALTHIQTGQYRTVDDAEGKVETSMILPNVRLANGEVAQRTRDVLVSAFNMPFFPEILIASSVLSEGVDLHWECRTVIHHDLDWNPSTLEQRTGRLDRIGSMAESVSQPIDIFEPYTTGLQDEKTFKVVKDRARWFNVVMGDDANIDDEEADRIAARVPMPIELVERLTLNLTCAE